MTTEDLRLWGRCFDLLCPPAITKGGFKILWGGEAAADPGSGAGTPLTQGFQASKLSIFGSYLIFPFFASLHSAYYFFDILLFHSSNSKIFQPCFAQHLEVFVFGLSFTQFGY